MPDMPLQVPVTEMNGKINFLWMRHFLSLNDTTTALQGQTSNLANQTADLQTQTAGIVANGPTVAKNLPTYANQTAAVAGGLTEGALYKTSAGVVQIVL